MGLGSRYPGRGWAARLAATVMVSPTLACRTSFTPVTTYPTSPTPSDWSGKGSGANTPTSSVSDSRPVAIMRIRPRGGRCPSTTRT
jgi:hypothetical protein